METPNVRVTGLPGTDPYTPMTNQTNINSTICG